MIKIPQDFLDVAQLVAANVKVDILLLAAIAKHETNFGTLGAGLQGYILGYGVYSETSMHPRFKGMYNQLYYAALQLTGYLGPLVNGETTFEQLDSFAKNSWKAGDVSWQNGVWYWYEQIKEGYAAVNIVYYFGSDDLVWASRVAEKVNGLVAPRTMLGRITPSVPYIVGGDPVEGAAANLTGADFLETSEKTIAFLRR